jgi:methylenetetrahydrofolate dehydrogenase (NADP+)/methenyltetrahydrofolate cyclohydrolase
MSAVVIDGRAIAASVRAEVAAEIASTGLEAGLATILVGDDPASEIYVRGKIRACEEVGIASIHHHLPADASQDEVVSLLEELNDRDDVSGILLQLPVPDPLDGQALTELIDPDKDVDGLTPISAGRLLQNRPGLRPNTPLGCIELLDRHGVSLEGANAVVVGRSDLVGRPVAQLLLHRNATVTMCHSRTRDLAAECRRADVLIAAVGVPRLVQGDWVKPGSAVIDVGINRTDEGLVGDVDFAAASERAALITPVPGGVGPMTIAMLLRNTLQAARTRQIAA